MNNIYTNIASELKEGAHESGAKHLEAYLKYEDTILQSIAQFTGIKSELYCKDISNLNETSKLLSIYSDFTSVLTAPSDSSEYHIQYVTDPKKSIDRNVTIPTSLLNSSLNKGYPIIPGYLFRNDADTKKIARIIDPLLSSGKFLLRPIRTLLVQVPKNANKNHNEYGEIFFANSDTPNSHWFAKEINEVDGVLIENGLKTFQTKNIFELTLPYFSNISLENLSKLVEEESDLIGKFRFTLKELGKKILENDNLSEYRNDIIRPELETINRKFSSLAALHKMASGISVATFTLSLLAIQVNSNINFQTLFNTLAGSSGLGLLASEIRYQTELEKIKDNPYFLIWKISKVRK